MKLKQNILRTLFKAYQVVRSIRGATPTEPPVMLEQNLEDKRLNELYSYKILDTIPEKIFDDLTVLASEICQTPMAQISLIDADRLWYKSNVGITETELPREITFCTHTVNQKGLMIVSDTMEDNRFFNNPIVRLFPKIRFYAGAPLISSNGYNLGSLCVLDNQPRQLTTSQQNTLEILAKQTVALLELHKLSLAIKQSNLQLREEILLREKAEVASRHASLHDPLTSLPNRRFLEQRLTEFLSKGQTNHFALLFVDLDKFKDVNDNHGHAVGDEILRIVASRLQNCIRQNDHISRIGGDEFIILINHNDRNHIESIAEKILSSIRIPIKFNNELHSISTSIGVAYYPNDGTDFDALLAASDEALYEAKNSGKNQFMGR